MKMMFVRLKLVIVVKWDPTSFIRPSGSEDGLKIHALVETFVRMGGSRRVLVICRVASKQKVEMSHDDSDQKALLYASKNWQSRDQWSGGGRGGGSRESERCC